MKSKYFTIFETTHPIDYVETFGDINKIYHLNKKEFNEVRKVLK